MKQARALAQSNWTKDLSSFHFSEFGNAHGKNSLASGDNRIGKPILLNPRNRGCCLCIRGGECTSKTRIRNLRSANDACQEKTHSAQSIISRKLSLAFPNKFVPERTRISSHPALEKAAYAPFRKEGRMKYTNATKSNRKSGVAERRDLRCAPRPSQILEFSHRFFGPCRVFLLEFRADFRVAGAKPRLFGLVPFPRLSARLPGERAFVPNP